MLDHDELRSSLLELTEPRQAPPDPAALVRHRVSRVRRRRHGAISIVAAATATAAVLAAGQITGLLRSGTDQPAVSGSPATATPAATPSPTPTYNDPASNAKLPPPWKDREYTKFPERNLYGPQGIYLAQGELGGHDWHAVTYTDNKLSEGCIAAEADDRDTATELGLTACFDRWPAGRRADWATSQAYVGRKPNLTPLDATFVAGAVSAEARSVLIKTANGREYRVDAVGTPTSDKLRFFFTVIPQRGAKVTAVRPLTAGGSLAGPPLGLPANGGSCYDGPREGFPNGGGSMCIMVTPDR